jgi:hypothetical protein
MKLVIAVALMSLILSVKPPHQQIDASDINIQPTHTSGDEKITSSDESVQTEAKVEAGEVKIQPPKPSHPRGCENYKSLLERYHWNVDTMLKIMYAESRCNPMAVGDDYPIRGLHAPSCGLMQVRTLTGRPDCQSLKDPSINIDWAWKIYQSQGYKAWTVCRTVVNCQ